MLVCIVASAGKNVRKECAARAARRGLLGDSAGIQRGCDVARMVLYRYGGYFKGAHGV